MMRKLILAAAAALLVGQAFAATPVYRQSPQGPTAVYAAQAPLAFVSGRSASAAAETNVVYSNFGSAEALYDSG
mgnify:CR=1 FL=1